MESFLYSPGPTHVPPAIRSLMTQESLHHRSLAFSELMLDCLDKLKRLFFTEGEVAVLNCSGSGGMEAAAMNIVSKGSKVLTVEGGKFGRRWSKICRSMECEVIPIPVEMGKVLKAGELIPMLKLHPDARAVFLTQVESSSGVIFNIQELAKAVKTHSEAAVVVDVIGSLGAEPFFLDSWSVDAAVCSSQKGLMCPPGLALVAVSPSGFSHLIKPQSLYWNLLDCFEAQQKGYTPFTPAVTLLKALHKALEMIFEEGLEKIWDRVQKLGSSFRKAVNSAGLHIAAVNPAAGMTVIKLPKGMEDKAVIEKLEEDYGYRIAGGQEEFAGKVIRIAHMGAIGTDEIEKLIPALFQTLKELGYDCQPKRVLETFKREMAED